MEVDNVTCDVIEEQVEKEITKGLTRNKVSRERLKIISKYINIFEVIVIARYIDYKLIHLNHFLQMLYLVLNKKQH